MVVYSSWGFIVLEHHFPLSWPDSVEAVKVESRAGEDQEEGLRVKPRKF